MIENTKQQDMSQLLAELAISKEKESLKQEKANTTQIKIHSELYEQVSKLESQSEAVENVRHALAICSEMDACAWADASLKRQAVLLLKEAIKRARLSYK